MNKEEFLYFCDQYMLKAVRSAAFKNSKRSLNPDKYDVVKDIYLTFKELVPGETNMKLYPEFGSMGCSTKVDYVDIKKMIPVIEKSGVFSIDPMLDKKLYVGVTQNHLYEESDDQEEDRI